MTVRSLLVIVLAVLCGLAAAGGLNMILSGGNDAIAKTIETVPVLVTTAPVGRGSFVTTELMAVKQWPKNLAPQGALSEIKQAQDRAALQPIAAGEPLFDAKLAAFGAIGGMANLIPPGKRAYTVRTKSVSSNVAGFLLPGNLVDVLLTFRGSIDDETGGGSTTTLLQAVEVLAVGDSVEPPSTRTEVGKKDSIFDVGAVESVTLLVSPNQVARLDLGQTLGILSLTLRNPDDREEADADVATIKDIRFRQMRVEEGGSLPLGPGQVSLGGGTINTEDPLLPASPGTVIQVAAKDPDPIVRSIRTLRGQSWGAVQVTIPPTADQAVRRP